jgi:hypothetical protein
MAMRLKDKATDRLTRERMRAGNRSPNAWMRLRRGGSARLFERLIEIGRHCAALQDIGTRSPDEILGYHESGVWR